MFRPCQVNPTVFQELPKELVLMIFEELDDYDALTKLAQCSRECCRLAQRILYRTVWLDDDALPLFHRTIMSSDRIANLVLRIGHDLDWEIDESLIPLIKSVLPRCNQIAAFMWNPSEPEDIDLLWPLIPSKHLLHLDIPWPQSSNPMFSDILEKFPKMISLRLEAVHASLSTSGRPPCLRLYGSLLNLAFEDIIISPGDIHYIFQQCPSLDVLKLAPGIHSTVDLEDLEDAFKIAPKSIYSLNLTVPIAEFAWPRKVHQTLLLTVFERCKCLMYLVTTGHLLSPKFFRRHGYQLRVLEIEFSIFPNEDESSPVPLILEFMNEAGKFFPWMSKLRLLCFHKGAFPWHRRRELDVMLARTSINVEWLD